MPNLEKLAEIRARVKAKLRSGGTPTAREIESLKDPVETKNLNQMAAIFGCTRDALQKWKKQYPELAPKGLKVADWKEFARKISSKAASRLGKDETGDRSLRYTKAEAEARKATLQGDILELEYGQLKRDLIDVKLVNKVILALVSKTKSLLRTKLESELPAKMEHLTPTEAREILVTTCDEICRTLNEPATYADIQLGPVVGTTGENATVEVDNEIRSDTPQPDNPGSNKLPVG
jgi:hypothetical protein